MYLGSADDAVVVIKLMADDVYGNIRRGQNHETATRMLRRRAEQDRDERCSFVSMAM